MDMKAYDGGMIKETCLALEAAAGKVDVKQSDIIRSMIDKLSVYPAESALAVVAEGTKKFNATERETHKSAYQYASRMKAIFGAYLLTVEGGVMLDDKPLSTDQLLSGGVNTIYSTATAVLRETGRTWKGEDATAVREIKDISKRAAAQAVEEYKLKAEKPEATMDDLRREAAERVSAQQAAAMLETLQQRAEKAAEKLIEQLGKADAMVYAQAFIQAIAARQ